LERAKDTPTGFQCETGDASTVSNAWITIVRASALYALSGVRGASRAKGIAARADGLVIKFERADAVDRRSRGERTFLFVATMSHLLFTAPVICIHWHGVVVDLLPKDQSLNRVAKAGS